MVWSVDQWCCGRWSARPGSCRTAVIVASVLCLNRANLSLSVDHRLMHEIIL